MKLLHDYKLGFLAGAMMLTSLAAAQPSGGPYGPVPQRYDLPDVKGRIYFVSPEGDRDAEGDTPEQPTTLEAAIEKVVTNDAIVLRGGTYRTGNLVLNQGITMQPYLEEQPVIKGSRVATDWEKTQEGLWRTSWTTLFHEQPAGWWRREQNIRFTPLHRFNDDMVFVDGRFLQSAGSTAEVDAQTFYIDYEKQEVFIGTDPSDRLIEITAYNSALVRTTDECHGKVSDKIGPVIRGITFTQYAYRALDVEGTFPEGLQDESRFGKEVVGTVLEHCEISFCSRVAAYLKGDNMVIRHCKISDTSTEGIYIMSSSDVLLEHNIFARNNIERITGYYPAAVKIFNQTRRVTCRDNLITDHPYSNGIWYDVGNVDGRFLNNWVRNVGMTDHEISYNSVWPSQNGFFFEISKGAVVAGNVFENCDHGILVLNSSNAEIYQNTLINSMLCIARDERSAEGDHFGWHPSTGPGVDERYGHELVNNLLVATQDYNRPLLMVWQPGSLCERLQEHPFRELDHNVYVHAGAGDSEPMILWSPAGGYDCQVELSGPGEVHDLHPALSEHSLLLTGREEKLFPGSSAGNFCTSSGFSGHTAATPLPENIRALIDGNKKERPYVGACPSGD
ncbi:MAG: right-handed parallel beta-helix repeat-containing protein [Bacteroidales bacterium]